MAGDNLGGIKATATALDLNSKKGINAALATAATDVASLANTLDQFGAPAANVAMNTKKLTGLAAGAGAGDSVRYEQAILVTGANSFTADQPMGTNKLTGLAAGTATGHSVRYDELVSKSMPFGSGWQQTAANASVTTKFLLPGGGNAPNTLETLSVVVAPMPGTLISMYVVHGSALSTDSVTYTVRINGVDSALAVTIAATGTAGNSTGASIAVSAGDKITIKSVQSSTQANANLNACVSLAWKSTA